MCSIHDEKDDLLTTSYRSREKCSFNHISYRPHTFDSNAILLRRGKKILQRSPARVSARPLENCVHEAAIHTSSLCVCRLFIHVLDFLVVLAGSGALKISSLLGCIAVAVFRTGHGHDHIV